MIRVVIAIALSALVWCGAQAQFAIGPKAGNGFGFVAPSVGGGSSVTILQNLNQTGTTATNTITLSPTAAGSVIVVVPIWGTTASATITIADSAGDTVTDSGACSAALGQVCYDNNSNQSAVRAFLAASTGVTSVTVTYSASTNNRLHVYEVAGLSSKTFDAHPAIITNQAANPATSPASGTLSSANEFVVAYLTDYTAISGLSGGFTSDGTGTTPFNNVVTHLLTSSTASVQLSAAYTPTFAMGVLVSLK